MKDLKYLAKFEELLQESNNELIQAAKKKGEKALGFTCYYIPEVLLNLPGCFSVRLRAPNTRSVDLATYYMTAKTCTFTRSILERAIEGGYNFLDALISSETCQMMHRGHEHFEMLGLVKDKNPKFFLSMMDVPFIDSKEALEHYKGQLQSYILEPLAKVYGIDTSEAALRDAINRHNEICRLITSIGELRKQENPPITGYEFHILQLVSECCPQQDILGMLRETFQEIQKRKPEPKPWYRARVIITGSEIDDPEFTKLLESCGAFVVADRYCYGSLPGREEIEVRKDETALDAIARHYLMTSQCPRFMNKERSDGRREYIRSLVKEYNADGVIYYDAQEYPV
jgi:benzoyl-CoA reductase/2-hydroxyglutaryl-CoA dehydratase subunit BcrC/BadD/HgdB